MHYLIVQNLYEDGSGVVRPRPIASFAENEEACMTCCKITYLEYIKVTMMPQDMTEAPIIPSLN